MGQHQFTSIFANSQTNTLPKTEPIDKLNPVYTYSNMPLDPFTTTDNINSDNICKEILEKINLDHEPLTTSPPPLLSTSTLTSQPMHCMDSCLASEKQSNANRQLSRQNICSFMAQEIFPPSITVYSKYPYLHFALGVDTTTHPLQTVIAALSYHGNNHTHATT